MSDTELREIGRELTMASALESGRFDRFAVAVTGGLLALVLAAIAGLLALAWKLRH